MGHSTKFAAPDHSKAKQSAIPPSSFSGGSEEERQQYAAALECVARLAQVVGRPTDPLTVTIDGHANAGFVPGATQQKLTITIANTQ